MNVDSLIGENHLIKYGVNWRHMKGKPNQLIHISHYQEKTDLGVYEEGICGIGAVTIT